MIRCRTVGMSIAGCIVASTVFLLAEVVLAETSSTETLAQASRPPGGFSTSSTDRSLGGAQQAHAPIDPATVDGYVDVAQVFTMQTANVAPAPVLWRYTTATPAGTWVTPSFDDSSWPESPAGFGGSYYPAPDEVNTLWSTTELWARRSFTIAAEDIADLAVWGRWDDSIEIYFNGVLASSSPYWTAMYRYYPINDAGRAALQPGLNVIAVHCTDFGGGRYMDIGLAASPFVDLPSTGYERSPELEVFTNAVHDYMKANLIPAGVLAVMKEDQVVVLRGFGYMEKTLETPVPPNAMLRLASNDKLITKAAIMELIASGAVDPVTGLPFTEETLVFPMLQAWGINPPPGITPDPRINTVTVGHLLEHRSGISELPWQSELYATLQVPPGTTGPDENVRWVYGAPLFFTPGTNTRYSSSGYMLLRYLIDRITGNLKSFLDNTVLAPCGTTDVDIAHERIEGRDPREPWYATLEYTYDRWINLENYFALTASAEGMVRFLRRYHMGYGTRLVDPVTGEWAAVPDNGSGVFFGGMAGTWSVTVQRRYDQVNLAVIFNQAGHYDALYEQLIQLADGISDQGWALDVPTVSEWGMVVMTLLVLTGGSAILVRKRFMSPVAETAGSVS